MCGGHKKSPRNLIIRGGFIVKKILIVLSLVAFSLVLFASIALAAQTSYSSSISMSCKSTLLGEERDYTYTNFRCTITPTSFGFTLGKNDFAQVQVSVGTGNTLTFTPKKTSTANFTKLNAAQTITLGDAGVKNKVRFKFKTYEYALYTASGGVTLASYN
jgi:hypothetical protein